jgi:hypothetical protein
MPIVVKFEQKYRHFAWKSKYVLLLLVSIRHHKSPVFDGNGIRLLVLPSFRPSVHPSVRPSINLSVCPNVSSRFPLDRFTLNWGLLWKSVEEFQTWLKSSKISDTSNKYVSTFYCCLRHKIAIKALSSSEMVPGRWDSQGINITRKSHNVTSHAHCLSPSFIQSSGTEEQACHDLRRNSHCHETPSVLTCLDFGSLVAIS